MALKDFQGRGGDIFDDIAYAVDSVSTKATRLRNNTRPTVPRYNFTTDLVGDKPLNPAEGQIAVGADDNSLRYYVNSQWRSAVGGDWKDLDLQSPWTAVPPYHVPAQYMILAEEYFFRGGITGGTDTDLVATLPVDDRPEFFHRYLISKEYQVAFIEVNTDGTIYMKSSS